MASSVWIPADSDSDADEEEDDGYMYNPAPAAAAAGGMPADTEKDAAVIVEALFKAAAQKVPTEDERILLDVYMIEMVADALERGRGDEDFGNWTLPGIVALHVCIVTMPKELVLQIDRVDDVVRKHVAEDGVEVKLGEDPAKALDKAAEDFMASEVAEWSVIFLDFLGKLGMGMVSTVVMQFSSTHCPLRQSTAVVLC
jgi:hypothetical protein